MLSTIKRTGLILILVSTVGCSKIDDYMLGKDNTPNPEPLKTLVSKQKLTEKWVVPVAAGGTKKNNAYLKLKPVVIDKIIYTADNSGVIQATNKTNGKQIWSKKTNLSIISGPVVAKGFLVVGTDSSEIVAFKQSNGDEVWKNTLSSDVLAKPLIAQNKIIAKTIDGNLYAFELATGKQLWLSNHGAPSLILKASSSPVIVQGNMLLVGYSDGKMDAVDLQTGQVLWQRSIAYATGSSDIERLVDIDADPIVEGDTALLATYQGYVGALALSSGQFIWRKPASTFSNIAVKGNTLFMTDSNDIIWSINKHTGQVNWKQTELKARGLTEPVIMDDQLIFGDKTGVLHILSAHNGEFISRAQLSGAITIAPSVVGKNIYVMTTNGKLSRFLVS